MNTTEQATKVIGDILFADPQIAHEMRGDEPDQIARALADAGLLAPAPLREEWTEAFVVATWRHTRWVESHAPVPGEPMLRGSHGADALHTECAVCREVLVPARFERVPVDRTEGDGGGA